MTNIKPIFTLHLATMQTSSTQMAKSHFEVLHHLAVMSLDPNEIAVLRCFMMHAFSGVNSLENVRNVISLPHIGQTIDVFTGNVIVPNDDYYTMRLYPHPIPGLAIAKLFYATSNTLMIFFMWCHVCITQNQKVVLYGYENDD